MSSPQLDHAVANVLIVDGDKFLIVQEGRPGREGLYNLPGGHIDAHETLFEAAIRETKEETGYDVELTGLIGFYQEMYPHINVSGPIFSAKIVGGSATPTPEHPEIKWITQAEVHQLAKEDKLFTKRPLHAVDHYAARGTFPLDIVTTNDYTK